MEQIKETENQDNQLVEVGQVSYWCSETSYTYGCKGSGILYIRNTFGILSVLVKIEDGLFFLVIPNKTKDSAFNAYFEIKGKCCYLKLPDNLITVLQKGSLS